MRKLITILGILFSIHADAQISMTYLNHWQLTPGTQDSSGVFCRSFYHSGRNKFYAVYAGRPGYQPGPMQYFAWQEYDANFNPTGINGTLSGFSSAGDYAMVMVGNYYYHITAASPWDFKLSKYDEDFNLVNSVTFPLDSSDSQADMLLNYTNGKLIIGAFHESTAFHPSMPTQSPSWTPVMHKWEYDLNLNSVSAPVYLNEIFTTWGASCIFNNNQYNIITMRKWPNYMFNVYRYDTSWNYIDSVNLNYDGQWSQGVIWDGNYYYVAYHSGNEHRSGNITVAIYDINWTMIYDTTITSYSVFVLNTSPPLNTLQYNANRPVLTKINDTLYVSYDVDDYMLTAYGPPHIYAEGNRWQAHVMKFKLNGVTGINEPSPKPFLSIYPNPTTDQTILQTVNSLNNATLTVNNYFGQTVKQIKNINGQTVTLFRDNLPSGLYFIRLTEDNKIFSVDKLVITD